MTTLTPQPLTPSEPLRKQSEKRYTNEYIKELREVQKRAWFSIFLGCLMFASLCVFALNTSQDKAEAQKEPQPHKVEVVVSENF